VTDDTRDQPSGGDREEPPETTSDGRSRRSPPFGRTDREPTGTADSTRTTTDQPTVTDPDSAPSEDPNGDRLEERLRAVERALTGTDDAVADLGDEASAAAERKELAARLDDLEARVEELEAATQAIRGYVGSIRSVNQAVERRADLALAKASGDADGVAEGGSTARDGVTGNGNPNGGATAGGGRTTGVPNEADLEAAIPTDRHRESGTERPSESAVDRRQRDGARADRENANDSWRAGALDRLRDNL